MNVKAPFHMFYSPELADEGAVVDRCAAETEALFLAAGDHLQTALDVLNRMKSLFARLETGLGADAAAEFTQATATLQDASAAAQQSITAFAGQVADLQAATQSVGREIADLDRVVRTITTLAVTARVIGHSMVPPQPKVAAFVENLSLMAGEAEAILIDVRQMTNDIRAELLDLVATVGELDAILVDGILTVIGRLALAGEKVQSGRAGLAQTNATLNRHLSETFDGVSQLIIALQAGDSFRQRLGRVRATQLCLPDMHDSVSAATALDLSAALLRGACSQADHDVSPAIATLHNLQDSATSAIRFAQRFYLGASSQAMGRADLANLSNEMKSQLAKFDLQLRHVETRCQSLLGRLQFILDQERMLRAIGQKVRLAGVNAIVICTQLGPRGNALREVAQWLRGMTDEADLIIGTLQPALVKARMLSDDLGSNRVTAVQTGAARIFDDAAGVQRRISKMQSLTDMATKETGQAAKSLPAAIDPAIAALTEFERAFGQLAVVITISERKRAQLQAPPGPLPLGADAMSVFDALREDYTMEAERQIHDQVLGQPAQTPTETSSTMDAPVDPVDDLDDILF